MSYNITVEGGKSVKLTTAGKYCDRDIVVTAEGEDLDEVLTKQDELLEELVGALDDMPAGGEVVVRSAEAGL